jgi:hypothetical protein
MTAKDAHATFVSAGKAAKAFPERGARIGFGGKALAKGTHRGSPEQAHRACPLSGVKRTLRLHCEMSASDAVDGASFRGIEVL